MRALKNEESSYEFILLSILSCIVEMPEVLKYLDGLLRSRC